MFEVVDRPAMMCLTSMICVCAAAAELHRDQTQWMISAIASRDLEYDAARVLDTLAEANAPVEADYVVNDRQAFQARIERTPDASFKATVSAESATLFLRYLGVASLPVQVDIEFHSVVAGVKAPAHV